MNVRPLGKRHELKVVGGSYKLRLNPQRTVNLIPTRDDEDVVLTSRPGLKSFSTIGGAGRGAHVFAGTLYVVVGDDLYSVSSTGTTTNIGSVTGSGRVTMADDGDYLVVATGSTGYTYDGSTFATISDADFPSTAEFPQFLDDYIIVTGSGGQFNWQLSDPTSWDGTDFATAEGAPDDLLSVVVDHREIWLFGEETTEIWFNDGTTPFRRAAGGFIERGCLAKHSPNKLDNTVFWLGDDGIVYRAESLIPIRISTHYIEKQVKKATDAYSYAFTYEGHPFYVLTAPGVGTYVYDVSTNLWHDWESFGKSTFEVSHVVRAYNKLLALGNDGNVYELDPDTFEDKGDTLERSRTTDVLNIGHQRYTIDRLELEVETGHDFTDPLMWLQVSRDRGKTWSDKKYASVGNIGEYNKRVYWNALGQFYDASFRFGQTDATKTNWKTLTAFIS